jgi:hypothetical protein
MAYGFILLSFGAAMYVLGRHSAACPTESKSSSSHPDAGVYGVYKDVEMPSHSLVKILGPAECSISIEKSEQVDRIIRLGYGDPSGTVVRSEFETSGVLSSVYCVTGNGKKVIELKFGKEGNVEYADWYSNYKRGANNSYVRVYYGVHVRKFAKEGPKTGRFF